MLVRESMQYNHSPARSDQPELHRGVRVLQIQRPSTREYRQIHSVKFAPATVIEYQQREGKTPRQGRYTSADAS